MSSLSNSGGDGGGRRSSSAGRHNAARKGVSGVGLDADTQPAAPLTAVSNDQVVKLEHAAVLQEQDAILDKMSISMGTLADMSSAISSELDEQATLLEDTSLAADVATGDMEAVTKKINKLVERAGGAKSCGILTCLTTVLIILLFIAFI